MHNMSFLALKSPFTNQGWKAYNIFSFDLNWGISAIHVEKFDQKTFHFSRVEIIVCGPALLFHDWTWICRHHYVVICTNRKGLLILWPLDNSYPSGGLLVIFSLVVWPMSSQDPSWSLVTCFIKHNWTWCCLPSLRSTASSYSHAILVVRYAQLRSSQTAHSSDCLAPFSAQAHTVPILSAYP